MSMWNSPLYGNYRTRSFSEIFPSVEQFIEEYENNGIVAKLSNESITTLYYLLYGRYGNSHIASSDENTFKYRVWSNIFMYGPTWEKRVEIQDALRSMDIEELRKGTKMIHNHSLNPSTKPSTSTLDELTTINEQNTTQNKKSLIDTYTYLMGLLETDVTRYFLDTFQRFFLSVVAPEVPLWYVTPMNPDDETNPEEVDINDGTDY